MDSKGYSLVELLIVLAVSTVILSGLFFSLNYLQVLSNDVVLRCDRDSNLWMVPLLLVQWVAVAGNNRWGHDWDGVRILGGISEFKSDMDGSGGFPDEDLYDSYEDIALDQRRDALSIRSGAGYFQPVLRGIKSFETEVVRDDLLIFRWSGETERPQMKIIGEEISTEEMRIHLWNYRRNLFFEGDQ